MAAEVRPAELAALLDLAERPRDSGWSLRAALVRYGQPEPQRTSDLMELVRRIESALRPSTKLLEKDGPAVWAAMQGAGDAGDQQGNERLVALLGAMAELDSVSEQLSAWAVTAATDGRPDAAVDAAITSVTAQLEALGIEREERPRPPGARSRS